MTGKATAQATKSFAKCRPRWKKSAERVWSPDGGGEEFLILTKEDPSLIEKVRAAVEQMEIVSEGETIKVTLTAGVEKKDKSMTLDKWIVCSTSERITAKTEL